MTSDTHAHDPTPTIPSVFVDPARMARMTQEIKGFSGEAAEEESAPEMPEEMVPTAPRIVSHTVLATRESVREFGDRLVASAHALGFAAALRLRGRRIGDELGTVAAALLALHSHSRLGACRVLCLCGGNGRRQRARRLDRVLPVGSVAVEW